MDTLAQVAIALLGVLGAGGGLYSILTVSAAKRKMVADADGTVAATVRVLGTAAADMIEPLQRTVERAERQVERAEARVVMLEQELQRVQGELRAVQQDLQTARFEAASAVGRLQYWQREILEPDATVARLRALVGGPPPQEGRHMRI